MKLTKKQQQFIKDAYSSNDVCSEWKTKIKDNFPKLFKETELEVGKWYKGVSYIGSNVLGCYKPNDTSDISYGFYNGKWEVNKNGIIHIDGMKYIKPATKEEVEQALIAEAKNRGFKKGVFFNSLNQESTPGYKNAEASNKFGFTDYNNRLHCNGFTAFYKGKWAEIIETITKEQAEKELGKKIVG